MNPADSPIDPVHHALTVNELPSGYERYEIDDLTESLLTLAIAAGQQAARHIFHDRPDELSIVTKSSATDMVTQMDKESEQILVDMIMANRPGDIIIGEEETVDYNTRPASTDLRDAKATDLSGVTWWLDPIDGTTNYVYNHPGFNISIAAGIGDHVLVGVVVDPFHDIVYSARFGHGAFSNDQPLVATPPPAIPSVLLATGFSYSPERRRAQMTVMSKVIDQVRDIRRMGAAAMDLCGVASGRVDAYYELGLSLWDFAAGALIASEAGYVVRSLESQEVRGASILAAHPENFEALERIIVDAGALTI